MKSFCVICTFHFTAQDEISACPCGHVYHAVCLNKWLSESKTCPSCRKSVVINKILKLYFSNDNQDHGGSMDSEELHSKLISVEAKLYNAEHRLMKVNEELSKQIKVNDELKKECFKYNNKLEKLENTNSGLKIKVMELEELQKSNYRMKSRVEELTKRLKILEHVELLLQGCEADPSNVLDGYGDAESRISVLMTFYNLFQRELQKLKSSELKTQKLREISDKERSKLRNQMVILQKKLCDKDEEIKLMTSENASLQRRLNEVSSKFEGNESLQRIIYESPMPLKSTTPNLQENSEKSEICQPLTPCDIEFKSKMSVTYADIYSDKKKFRSSSSHKKVTFYYNGLGGHCQEPIRSTISPKSKSQLKKTSRKAGIKTVNKKLKVNGQCIQNFFKLD